MTIEFASKANYNSIEQLYYEAFPRHERLPFFMLKKGVKKRKAEIIIAKESGKVIAFAYMILYCEMAYLFYFAVDASLRNKGIGSLLIKYIKEHYQGKRIFLAVEQPNDAVADNELRIRRKVFYLRNGFKEQKCKLKEKDVLFDVVGIGEDVTRQEYINMFNFWGGKTFHLFMKITITE